MDRNVTHTLETALFGYPIRCSATLLDTGLHVLIVGGCQSHIGAVSTCLPEQEPDTRFFPGHKDQYVSGPWAKALAQKLSAPVCVVCGIHYDNATGEQIARTMEVTDGMLSDLMKML